MDRIFKVGDIVTLIKMERGVLDYNVKLHKAMESGSPPIGKVVRTYRSENNRPCVEWNIDIGGHNGGGHGKPGHCWCLSGSLIALQMMKNYGVEDD